MDIKFIKNRFLVDYIDLETVHFTNYAKAHLEEVIIFFTMVIIFIVTLILAMTYLKRQALMRVLNEDELTGLVTEYYFIKKLIMKLKTAECNEYALISIDIDNFKYINEVYGYEKGTEVLKEFAKTLDNQYYKAELICRLKQDEFLVLIKNTKENLKIEENNESFKSKIVDILEKNAHISISKGIYLIRNTQEELHYMIDCTRQARKIGKVSYKDTSVTFTENMRNESSLRNKIIYSMEKGLQNEEFAVFYQEKVDVNTSKIVGAEGLVRWKFKETAIAYPNDFIRIFEENGFIKRLDMYVFKKICKFIGENKDKVSVPPISINLSGVTFVSEDLIENLTKIMNKYGVKTNDIELEITESAVVKKVEKVSRIIEKLRSTGFYVSMDDFGSGISSINRLKDINADEIKLDKSFLRNIKGKKQEKGEKILESIIKLAQELKMTTVVEGVENLEQLELLKQIKCNIAQGFYFSKPINEEEFLEKLIKLN